LAFDSRKLHRDVADLAMRVVNGAHLHIGAVDELEVGVDRATAVCCSKRRDASGTSVWKRGAVWNTCNNNNNNKSLLTVGRCGYCGGDTPASERLMDAPALDAVTWG
jgi:hypothetical protein